MSLSNFIPSIWAGNLLSALDKAHVAVSIANREYEGDIKQAGDSVRINQIGDITVGPYTKNSDIGTPQELADAQTILTIDQQNYFNFQIDDIDKAQTKPKVMSEAMRKSAYGLRDTADTYLLGLYAQAGLGVGISGGVVSPIDVTSLNVEDTIAQVVELMNLGSVPQEGRFAIIPPWFYTKLWLAGLTTKTMNDVLYANGKVDKILNIEFLMSNNVSKNSSSWDISRIFFGVRNLSLNFAEQIVSVEGYRPEKRFADAVKGLHVFGAKWRADATCVLYADKTAES